MTDETYKELPAHIRVITGGDLEYKCNKVIEEEVKAGFLLYKVSCSVSSMSNSDKPYDSDLPQYLIVLAFRMRKKEIWFRQGE